MTTVLETYAGPSEEALEAFRVKVGRYSERWYVDPLLACDLAGPTSTPVPSVSTVKKAWPSFFTDWACGLVAEFAVQHRNDWVGLTDDAAIPMISKAADRYRDSAANRGTVIHGVLDNLLHGIEPDPIDIMGVEEYVEPCRQFIADAKPRVIAAECPVIRRSDFTRASGSTFFGGYGGTFDCILEIDGENYLVDWKTRKPGKHAAYSEEGCQAAAYANADYMIIQDPDRTLRRVPLPRIDKALVVSITPESYKAYPVDLDEGWTTFQSLHEFWGAMADEKIIGRVKMFGDKAPIKPAKKANTRKAAAKPKKAQPETGAPEQAATPTTPPAATREQESPSSPAPSLRDNNYVVIARRAELRERTKTLVDLGLGPEAIELWDTHYPDIPKFKVYADHTLHQLQSIASVIETIEARHEVPFGNTIINSEGDQAGPERVGEMKAEMSRITDPAKLKVLDAVANDVLRHGMSISLQKYKSRRRLALVRLLVLSSLSGSLTDDADSLLIRQCVSAAIGNADPLSTELTLGAVIAPLDWVLAEVTLKLFMDVTTGKAEVLLTGEVPIVADRVTE